MPKSIESERNRIKKRKDKWLNIRKNANMNKNVEAIKFTKSSKTIEFSKKNLCMQENKINRNTFVYGIRICN